MRADVKANCFDVGEVAQFMCNSLMTSMAMSCHSLCTRFRFNTRLRLNTRSQCRAEGAPSMAMSAEGANARRCTRSDNCTARDMHGKGKHEMYGDERSKVD